MKPKPVNLEFCTTVYFPPSWCFAQAAEWLRERHLITKFALFMSETSEDSSFGAQWIAEVVAL